MIAWESSRFLLCSRISQEFILFSFSLFRVCLFIPLLRNSIFIFLCGSPQSSNIHARESEIVQQSKYEKLNTSDVSSSQVCGWCSRHCNLTLLKGENSDSELQLQLPHGAHHRGRVKMKYMASSSTTRRKLTKWNCFCPINQIEVINFNVISSSMHEKKDARKEDEQSSYRIRPSEFFTF